MNQSATLTPDAFSPAARVIAKSDHIAQQLVAAPGRMTWFFDQILNRLDEVQDPERVRSVVAHLVNTTLAIAIEQGNDRVVENLMQEYPEFANPLHSRVLAAVANNPEAFDRIFKASPTATPAMQRFAEQVDAAPELRARGAELAALFGTNLLRNESLNTGRSRAPTSPESTRRPSGPFDGASPLDPRHGLAP